MQTHISTIEKVSPRKQKKNKRRRKFISFDGFKRHSAVNDNKRPKSPPNNNKRPKSALNSKKRLKSPIAQAAANEKTRRPENNQAQTNAMVHFADLAGTIKENDSLNPYLFNPVIVGLPPSIAHITQTTHRAAPVSALKIPKLNLTCAYNSNAKIYYPYMPNYPTWIDWSDFFQPRTVIIPALTDLCAKVLVTTQTTTACKMVRLDKYYQRLRQIECLNCLQQQNPQPLSNYFLEVANELAPIDGCYFFGRPAMPTNMANLPHNWANCCNVASTFILQLNSQNLPSAIHKILNATGLLQLYKCNICYRYYMQRIYDHEYTYDFTGQYNGNKSHQSYHIIAFTGQLKCQSLDLRNIPYEWINIIQAKINFPLDRVCLTADKNLMIICQYCYIDVYIFLYLPITEHSRLVYLCIAYCHACNKYITALRRQLY